jgi:UDP-N-acetylmuramate-alanine ligase
MTLRLARKFSIGEAWVRARGEFNASNAAAALAAAQLMGVNLASTLLADYPGVRRRQTVLHNSDGVTVLEDYAHHPAEICALLGSLRKISSTGGLRRLIVVFQPHRFSRTRQFKAEFAEALAAADRVVLLDVYGAGEAPIAGGRTTDVFAELMRQQPQLAADHVANDAELMRLLTNEVRTGDLVAFVGAGDIDRKARAWIGGFGATR